MKCPIELCGNEKDHFFIKHVDNLMLDKNKEYWFCKVCETLLWKKNKFELVELEQPEED